MKRLLKLQGEKLPCEQVWVDAEGMYSVYDTVEVDIDNKLHAFIIISITEEGLICEDLH